MTLDPDLVRAGHEAVAEGRADSLSSWINAALVERAATDRRLRALAQAVAEYEAAFGAISDVELAVQDRADRGGARVVRAGVRKPTRRPRQRGAA